METKTVRLTSDMLKGVAYRAKMEDIDEMLYRVNVQYNGAAGIIEESRG